MASTTADPAITASQGGHGSCTRRASRLSARRFLAEGPQAVREAARGRRLRASRCSPSPRGCRSPSRRRGCRADAGVRWHTRRRRRDRRTRRDRRPAGNRRRLRFVDVALDDIARDRPRLVAVCADVRDPGNAGVRHPMRRRRRRRCRRARRHVGRPLQRQSRPLIGRLAVPPPGRDRGRVADASPTGRRERGLRCSPPTGVATTPRRRDRRRRASPPRRRGCSATRRTGCRRPTPPLADRVVAVPIYGRAESLNLATAAAVCLYASARAQRLSVRPGRGLLGGVDE